jgi:sporulation protein YlmC with PRC-barrel domain
MDIPVDANVYCTDGPCGHSTRVVLKKDTDEVTHLVIKEKHGSHVERLVPLKLVEETSSHAIQLGCTLEELDALAPFIQTELIPQKLPVYVVLDDTAYYKAGLSVRPNTTRPLWVTVKHEAIPADEVAVRRGAQVMATDGRVGRVDEFLVDADDERVTHLIMRHGHLWGRREVCIPISAIDQVWEEQVYLKLDKAAVGALPEVSLQDKRRL